MKELKLVSTVNAGVAFDFGGKRIWVDAIHDYKTRDFSTCTPEIVDHMIASRDIAAPDLMLFTHSHPDHCSAKLVNECLELWPKAEVICPQTTDILKNEFTRVTVPERDVDEYVYGDLRITFFKLTHDSLKFKDTPHRGILLEYEGKSLLFPGDTSIKSEELFEFLKNRNVAGGRIFAVFLNFPWLSLELGREKIKRIGAKHVIISHIPLE